MNSKDLRNISEAYQNIQEQPRRATRIPGATGEKSTGSLRSGTLSFPGDKSGAYDAAKQKLNPSTTPKVELPKIKTPPQTGGLLGTRTIKTPGNGLPPQAPKPEFGPGAVKPPTGATTPSLRPGGQTPALNLKGSLPKPPTSSVATLSRGARLLRGLKGLAKGPLALGAEIAADAALTPIAKASGDALAKGIVRATGSQERYPTMFGKMGPKFGVDVQKSVQARDAEASKNAVYGQRTNEYGQKSSVPSSGDPSTFPQGRKPAPVKPAPAAKLSAAAKDFDTSFADARKAGKAEFTWRGKQYNTKLKGE